MSQLLIHSMSEFNSIVHPVLNAAGVHHIAEVGAEHGGNSVVLAEYVAEHEGSLVSIDPQPSEAFRDWLVTAPQVRHVAHPSLEAIPQTTGIDAWFLDGDHNWYTVFNELTAIEQVCQRDAKPLLVFLHDVGWPCARRDMYYAPDRIPQQFRHPHSFTAGVTLDTTVMVEGRGFRGDGSFAYALREGGPRNGVLTAVEDFVGEKPERDYLAWACIPAVLGLGVLFDQRASWADAVAELLVPYHMHPLLMALEENRLRNYLAVIEWQDKDAEEKKSPKRK
jgi:hypothetical protein